MANDFSLKPSMKGTLYGTLIGGTLGITICLGVIKYTHEPERYIEHMVTILSVLAIGGGVVGYKIGSAKEIENQENIKGVTTGTLPPSQ